MSLIGVNNFNIHNVTASVGYQPQKSDNAVAVPADKFSASSDLSSKLIQDMSALKRSSIISGVSSNSVSSAGKTDKLGKSFSNAKNIASSCISGSPAVASAASLCSPTPMDIASMPMDEIYKMKNRDKLSEEEMVVLANRVAEDIQSEYNGQEIKGGELFSTLLNKFGYDALPQVLNAEKFNEEALERPIMYRGLESTNTISAQQMVNDFKYGKLFSGGSKKGRLFGRGTYIAFNKEYADKFKGNDKGVTMEMLMAPDSKTTYYHRGSNSGACSRDTHIDFAHDDFLSKQGRSDDARRIFEDIGSYAVLRGYDAYYCCREEESSEAEKPEAATVDGYRFMVVLNRGKVLIKE